MRRRPQLQHRAALGDEPVVCGCGRVVCVKGGVWGGEGMFCLCV
jgi:hypothetical protein